MRSGINQQDLKDACREYIDYAVILDRRNAPQTIAWRWSEFRYLAEEAAQGYTYKCK